MQHEEGNAKNGSWRNRLWMVLCCLPMIVIVLLVVLGFFGGPLAAAQ